MTLRQDGVCGLGDVVALRGIAKEREGFLRIWGGHRCISG